MIFTVRNGCFGYKTKDVLKDISFTVGDGEVLSVLGSNGVGKTTLLKCMMGLLKWKSGNSYVDGTQISEMKPKEFWKKIAYVPRQKEPLSDILPLIWSPLEEAPTLEPLPSREKKIRKRRKLPWRKSALPISMISCVRK